MTGRVTLTRREALQRTGAAAAVIALGPGVLAACGSGGKPASDVDVAIVGGGPSGLYAAYRLMTGSGGASGSSGGRPTVALFEASDRLGGRIWSVHTPGAPDLISEFGGMRFLRTQEIVPRLIKALKLPAVPFTTGNGRNLYYLRGERFTLSDFSDPARVPYSLPHAERGMTPPELLLKGIESYVPAAAKLSGAEWEHVKKTETSGGRLLANQGFWNLMQAALGSEGYDLMSDGVGYPSLFANWNAVEQMQSLAGDFAPRAAYFTLRGGYHKLPLRLAAIAKHAGAGLHLNSTVRSVEPASGGRVRLAIEGPGGTETVTAGRVIMAVPLDPLRAIVERSPFLQATEFTDALATVGTAPASKSFLTFDRPWWKELGITGGYSITDLPIKRCWYFGTEGQQPGANPSNKTSLLMCYNDLTDAGYWAGYQSSPSFNGPPAPRRAPRELVSSAVEALSQLHGIRVPKPLWAGFINWENLPYGNGFHFWEVNAHSWEVIPYLRQPFDGVNLSVCGDCWSPSQNWIESGLTTTEALMQTTLGLRRPPWLPEGAGISA